MSKAYLVTLSKLVAEQINNSVNIPFLSEEEEQKLFELLILKALETFFLIKPFKLKGDKEIPKLK